MELRNRPIPTVTSPADRFRLPNESIYVFGRNGETRSHISDQWTSEGGKVELIEILHETPDEFTFRRNDQEQSCNLHSRNSMNSILSIDDARPYYLDITGLPHHVWAPLVRTAFTTGKRLRVLYVEPLVYKHSSSPTEGELFDLSVRISGIAPLPGFTTLAEFDEERVCLVPLLGFEGTRFSYMLESVHPTKLVVPVIGVPGFRPEFPFYTYQGNKLALLETRSWKRARYAPANCPFSMFYLLSDIANDYARHALRIAPVGTKPHALGAVMFFLCRSGDAELVYDHPIRRAERSSGALGLHEYDVVSFMLQRCGGAAANVD